ncbi:hypothetical protein [Sulfodiicoccus acidiphilus]|uniref:hypothetical protein n=1 Tax=Sulfodiicoccus acidiphilus TaxID=1670455 RepID=UPI000F81C6BA|nr:hypothetical protein [Sulfodiicoccus acidiphilus]
MNRLTFLLTPVTPFTVQRSDTGLHVTASSVKGLLRTASTLGMDELLGPGHSCESLSTSCSLERRPSTLKSWPCLICRTYGFEGRKGSVLRVRYLEGRSSTLPGEDYEFKYRFLYRKNTYRVPVSRSSIEVTVTSEDVCAPVVVATGLLYIDQGVVRMGKFRSRGLGILNVKYREVPRKLGETGVSRTKAT